MTKHFKYMGKTYTKEELLNIFRELFLYTLNTTREETINWINKFVPKRSGELRESLLEWINTHWKIENNILKISLGTDVDYAFSIPGIAAHDNTWLEHSGAPALDQFGNKVLLNDPQAFEKWHTLIGDFIKNTFNTIFLSYKDTLLGG